MMAKEVRDVKVHRKAGPTDAGARDVEVLQWEPSMYHPKTMEWDDRMKDLFDRVDRALEDRYEGRWHLRRNRPARGKTANPEADGLFNVGVFFTPGYGSRLGKGYLVEVVIATEEQVPDAERRAIENHVRDLVAAFLPDAFPGRDLRVERDGTMFKIHGDLGMGSL
jgi:hypothetical protein